MTLGSRISYNSKSALYEVFLGEKKSQKGLLEIRQRIDGKKDLNTSGKPFFPLLKAKGLKEKDLDVIGTDYVLYIP